MLSISFYSGNGQSTHSIRVIDDFYEWLALSEFSKLGRSQPTPIEIEGEPAELPLVHLVAETRSKLIAFFSDSIVQETRVMLGDIENSTPPKELALKTDRLRKLLELLDCLKRGMYQYLQRE
jgi:hypothetical protein